jgi:protein ImuB
MLWLGLCLPRLPIEIFLRGVDPSSAALAVCDRLAVLMASEPAQALGVHAGMKRATALALAPGLPLLERDEPREQEALRQVACWALQFTPSVSLRSPPGEPVRAAARPPGTAPPPHGLLLEIAPSLRLFGGRDALVARIRAGLAELGFSASVGCAPTATGAWLLALHRDGTCAGNEAQLNAQLAALPVSLLEQAQPHLATIEAVGARSLKDLMQLPRAGLARRFGKPLLDELERAFGRQAEPRAWFEAPLTFSARLELLAQVEAAEALLFGARRLIVQLTGWLGARHAAVRALELDCEHDERPPTTLAVRLTDATRDAERLLALLRERLAVTRLAAPVHTLGLRCDDIAALAAPNRELFPMQASAREGLGRLIERLQARLGRTQVQRLLLAADHRPEAAYRIEAFDDVAVLDSPSRRAAAPEPVALATGALPRPLWLLARPVAISERNNRPYWQGPLTLLAGPERIESGWWDGRPVQRDYFIASDDTDMLLWIYRERVPQADTGQGWFIQGRFG